MRRKSILNLFSTPPLRPLLSRQSQKGKPPADILSLFRDSTSATGSEDDDDENTLTATGDISIYIASRHGTPHLDATTRRVQPRAQRPPPPRRVSSIRADKFRTLTIRGGAAPAARSRDSEVTDSARASSTRSAFGFDAQVGHPGDESFSFIIGSIEDEDPQLSTPQSRFEAFMRSRDLTRSPKKKGASVAERNGKLQLSVLGHEVARPASKPLRGNGRLPARMPIPDWGAMDVDED
ncbi:hypothetical protein C8F04DRAFT_1104555 [Mycena alexandri]|uniref:Uncharacterized protein n=1 Tax=Mycena alexandri TaxID=1745969 RepID=A0AAD6X2L0_9AGAR|nr:hypothetical protein C8F04DRAFT_1104555 [Mycena alexandri]